MKTVLETGKNRGIYVLNLIDVTYDKMDILLIINMQFIVLDATHICHGFSPFPTTVNVRKIFS